MTFGSGLSLAPNETDQRRQNNAIRQLMEGRSNAVGSVTLAHDGSATTTTVTANTCGPNSVVFLSPLTANAASAASGTYIKAADISAGQFVVTHDATSNTDVTFGWVCLG
jgi:hypothetical protein